MNPDMKRLKLLAAVAVLGVFACEEATPPPPVGSIVGQVAIEGTGIDGVSVNLSNGNSTTTSGGGSYRFDNVEGGAYTVTISGYPSDATFDQTSAAATISSTGQSVTINFTGSYIRTASVMGSVTVENQGLGGVTVALSGTSVASTVTDNNGQYAFTGLRMGSYSVEISGFNTDEVGFSSTSTAVSVGTGESKIVSFDGTYLRTAGIQGQVSVEGVGLEGVNVSLKGGPDGEDMTTTTDAAGLYSFAKLRAGDYAVGISGFNTDDYEFTVTSRNVTIALGETANVPFEGTLLRTSGIAGRVSVNGMGIPDVTVTVSADGMDDVTAMTDASGQYAVSALAAGDYTVAISGYNAVEYSFEDSQTVPVAKDATAIVNFEGTALRTASIAVSVTADGEGLAGAGVTLTEMTGAASGTLLGTKKTGADGGATFGPLLAGNYRVDIAVDSDEIDFESTDTMVSVATAEAASVTFEGAINRTASISGSVMVDGAGMGGVAVMLSGGEGDQSAETGDDGSYSFSGLRKGDYTVSITNPDENRYSFDSMSESVSLAVGQAQSVSFAGSMIRSSSISGVVGLDDGTGVDSVTVTLSGDADGEATTDAGGLYSFTGLGAGDYTVSIALSDDDAAAYDFADDEMSKSVTLGDDDKQTLNFTGSHKMTAMVSGMLFVDEGANGGNGEYDEGENAHPAPGVVVVLVGPAVVQQTPGVTDETGAFSFSGLRAGKYQLVVTVPAEVEAAMPDYAYAGSQTGYTIDLGVGQKHTQNLPFEITHTTVNVSVSLKSGDDRGTDPLSGATVTLYADAAGKTEAGSGTTGEEGMTSIRVAREGTTGDMVYAAFSHDDYHVDPDAEMQAVKWDPQMTSADASNDADIVNLNVDVAIKGATVDRGDYGGGEALGDWAISVMMGEDAVEGDDVPTKLEDDGTAHFTATVESVPATYTFAVADDQDNKLDGGEKYEADAVEYKHDGLSLMGTMEANPIVVTYSTQTLKAYVHHEVDQVEGYTGSILGGDTLASGMVSVNVRYIADNGRSRSFDAAVGIKKTDKDGVVTFTGVPADARVILTADEAVDDIMISGDDERAAYTMDDGAEGGLFGANGGFSSMVELCPLRAVDPTGQDHGKCGTFAFVNTHTVNGLVWKQDVLRNTANSDFTVKATPTFVPGITVSLTPVAGKNLEGDDESHTTTEKPVRGPGETAKGTEVLDETHQFRFTDIAAGVYALGDIAGWRVSLASGFAADFAGVKGSAYAANAAKNAFNPLASNVSLDVTPATGVVYGRVNGGDGFPVEGVTVHVNGESDVTDASGRYIVTGFKAQTRTINRVKHTNMVFVETAHPRNEPTLAIIGFAANDPTLQNISIAGVAETATIEGTVRMSGSGAAVEGAMIQVDGVAPLNPNAKSARTVPKNDIYLTDANGNYSVDVGAQPAGTNVTVTATKDGLTITPIDGIAVPALKDTKISGIGFNAFPNATIRGRVMNSAGTGPLSGVKLTATSTAAGTTEAADETTTNSVGFFELSVSWGTYVVAASKAGYTFGLPEGRDDWRVTVGPGDEVAFGTITSSVDDMIATLSNLVLSDVTLKYTDAAGDEQSGFMTGVTAYTGSVDNDVDKTTVTATATDAAATVAVTSDQDNDVGADNVVELEVGENTITVTVTAADGKTTGTYTVVVTRDDEHPKVTLVLTPDEIDESDGADPPVAGVSTVTATVAPAPTADFTVTVSIDAGAQVATLSDNVELTYDASASSWSGVVTITAVNDAVYTGDRIVTVSGASSDPTVAAHPDNVTLTIDEDESGVVPGPVQGLAAEAGDQQAKFTWAAPTQVGSDPITKYMWIRTAPSRVPASGELGADAREITFTGLDNGITYTFSVWAVSAAGETATDNRATAVTSKPVPNIILTLDGTTLTEGDTESPITAAVSLSNSSAEEIVFSVAEVIPENASARIAVANGDNVTIAAGQTAPAQSNADITITAVDNALDDGGAAAEVQATSERATSSDSDATEDGQQPHEITITDDDEAPGAPRQLTLTAGAASITAEWISALQGTTAVTGYEYRTYVTATGAPAAAAAVQGWTDGTSGVSITKVTTAASDTDMVNDTEYTVEVRAKSAAGPGEIASATATPKASS